MRGVIKSIKHNSPERDLSSDEVSRDGSQLTGY